MVFPSLERLCTHFGKSYFGDHIPISKKNMLGCANHDRPTKYFSCYSILKIKWLMVYP